MASSVNLGKVLEAYVEDLVKNGRYGSRSEVLREGIRLVQDRELGFDHLKAEIQKGIDASDAGHSEELGIVVDRLRRKYEAMATKLAA